MLNIDTDKMLIEITRGDTAYIVFSALDKEGRTYEPSVNDVLKFAVAKKFGSAPIFEIPNKLTVAPTNYVSAMPTEEQYNLEPTHYYTESGGVYTQCTSADPYDAEESYYILDYSGFWTITIGGNNEWYQKDKDGNVIVDADGNKTDLFKFSDYVWDLQLSTSTGVDTIIGKTDDISPTFRVLGEVATE